jgi:hypothetical protein
MICRRPGTPTSRVRSSVGLLLTLPSLLVCGTASAKIWTTASGDAAFDGDVALSSSSSPAEKAVAAALAQRLDFRTEDRTPRRSTTVRSNTSRSRAIRPTPDFGHG